MAAKGHTPPRVRCEHEESVVETVRRVHEPGMLSDESAAFRAGRLAPLAGWAAAVIHCLPHQDI